MTQRNIIVGGGVIGLSIAYELATRGHSVELLERDQCGQKASWAGAGILVPANPATAIHPLEHLEALSHAVHRRWSQTLKDQTGIENGFRRCGGIYVARTGGEVAALAGVVGEWAERQIEHQQLDAAVLNERFGELVRAMTSSCVLPKTVWVPGEAQFSNPHHLAALLAACRQLGVILHENVGETRLEVCNSRIESVFASGQSFRGDNFFLTSGPWTQQLVQPLGLQLPMQPVRGQIVLYKLDPKAHPLISNGPIVNEGSRYLVPRQDGHVLAGSTIEEVGFDCQTTEGEIAGLRRWAESLVPVLNQATFVKAWAGLRPGTYDGFPYLGRMRDLENALVATGHFKGGLHLSTGTAVVMADLAEQKTPSIDLRPFRPARAADHQSMEIR